MRRVDSVGCAVSTGRTSSPSDRLRHFLRGRGRRAEVAHRPLGRRGLRLGVRHGAVRARATHAMHLLGGVDEQEEERERARGDGAELERQTLRPASRSSSSDGARRIAVAASAAGLSQALDRVERLLALEPADDAPERGGEPADVLVEGDVLAADHRARQGDGAECRSRGGPVGARLTALVQRVRQRTTPDIDDRRVGTVQLYGWAAGVGTGSGRLRLAAAHLEPQRSRTDWRGGHGGNCRERGRSQPLRRQRGVAFGRGFARRARRNCRAAENCHS